MRPFLDIISERLINKFPSGMEDVFVVLPSKRAIVFLKSYLSKRISKPIFLPRFFTIKEFISYLSGIEILDTISLQFNLYNTYLKYPPKKVDSFDEFLKWSHILLHDFNEVDRNMVDAKVLFGNLKDAKELENWQIDDWSFSAPNLSKSQEEYMGFYNLIYRWYIDFTKELLSKGKGYQGMAYRKAAKEISDISIDCKKVWFVGLNALTQSEQDIIEELKQQDVARIFWDADEFYYNNPSHEAGEFLRKQRSRWSEIDFKGVGNYFSKPKKKIQLIACAKKISQAKVVKQLLSEFDRKDLLQSNTAIVLADETLLFPVLEHLPKNIEKLNVTMGSPLKYSAIFSFIDLLFIMQLHAKEDQNQNFYYKDVIAFLQHPFTRKISNISDLVNLENKLITQNKVFVSSSYLIETLVDLEIFFSIWKTSQDGLNALFSLIDILRVFLVRVKASVESEMLYRFHTCFTILQNQINDCNFNLEFKTLYTLLKQVIAKETIAFQGEPLDGLQIMGILETRTLDFKNIIMVSVNEGQLPKRGHIQSFIPFDLQKYFQMPNYNERDAVFSYHFYRLLQRASHVSLLYNTETDDFGSGEKSRFITQLLHEYKTSYITQHVFSSGDLILPKANKIIIKNIQLKEEIKEWAEKGVSPSALNKYINCSLSFYYHYLANIRKQDTIEEFADSSTSGTAIHKALEDHFPKGIISVSDYKKMKESIIESIEFNFIKILGLDNIREGKNYLILEIAKRITVDFLDKERSLVENGKKNGEKLDVLEKELTLKKSIKVDNMLFNLVGSVDRIDRFGDILRIIDYKSGKVEQDELTFKNWESLIENPKKGKAFQLFMYTYLYLSKHPYLLEKKIVAGNYSFKNISNGLLTISESKGKVRFINKQMLNEFETQLRSILNNILTEDFVQTNDRNNCKWCPYKMICNR